MRSFTEKYKNAEEVEEDNEALFEDVRCVRGHCASAAADQTWCRHLMSTVTRCWTRSWKIQ